MLTCLVQHLPILHLAVLTLRCPSDWTLHSSISGSKRTRIRIICVFMPFLSFWLRQITCIIFSIIFWFTLETFYFKYFTIYYFRHFFYIMKKNVLNILMQRSPLFWDPHSIPVPFQNSSLLLLSTHSPPPEPARPIKRHKRPLRAPQPLRAP